MRGGWHTATDNGRPRGVPHGPICAAVRAALAIHTDALGVFIPSDVENRGGSAVPWRYALQLQDLPRGYCPRDAPDHDPELARLFTFAAGLM